MKLMPEAAVDVVIVLYRSSDYVCRAIASLAWQNVPWVLHLVDNNPGDGSLKAALDAKPDAHVFQAGGNVGFGGGCNAGIADGCSPYILLLNPDATLEPGCLGLMLAAMEKEPEIAAIGPLVMRLDDGKVDSAGMEIVVPGWARDRARGEIIERAPETGNVECLSGGVLLLRREALASIGRDPCAFWSDLFLYNEDVELSMALVDAGWRLKYLKEARAFHAVGGSNGNKRQQRAFAARNRILTAIVYSRCTALFRLSFLFLWCRRICLDMPQLCDSLRKRDLRIAFVGLFWQAVARRRERVRRRHCRECQPISLHERVL